MARVQSLLFGEAKRPSLQRYALLEKLGEGAYGAVYSAWDPRLDRKVAVKVLHGGATEALEREARALAKLSHPNVVGVHDVGESGDTLFLAMEFVDGLPLSSMDTKKSGWRKVVATYRQAAAGLAAAHDAGVVHRDFKPANALLGRDGRVRVLDFGLARAGIALGADDGPMVQTRAGGTPRYMAPEQHRGDPVDARTDQYCFCAALWEALYAEPAFTGETIADLLEAKARAPSEPSASKAPTRVARILQRGMAPAPEDRFGSMRELDAALGRTLQRRTQALAGVGLTAVALVTGIGLGRTDRPCSDSDTPPARWTRPTRTALADAFARTGVPHAEATGRTTTDVLDRWTGRWGEARRDACMQHERGLQSAEGLDLRSRCLDAQRERFDALLDVLLDADATVVDGALKAASGLPSPGACSDVEALRDRHPIPPDQRESVEVARATLARGRAELEAGHFTQAAELATPVHDRCLGAELEHPPVCVEARLILGDAVASLGRHDEALAHQRAAAVEAQRAELPVAFGRAAQLLTWELSQADTAFDEALTWAALGQAALDREDAPEVLFYLVNAEAAALGNAGRFAEAIAAHERQLAMLDPDSPLRFAPLANLAGYDDRQGNPARADARFAEAIAIGEATLGELHPKVLMTRQNYAGTWARGRRPRKALDQLLDVNRKQRAVLGDDHPDISASEVNLSVAYERLRDADAALRHAREATRLNELAYGKQSYFLIESLLAEANAQLLAGRAPQAIVICERALGIADALLASDHPSAAYVLRAYGSALRGVGRDEEAHDAFETAREIFTKHEMLTEAASAAAQSKASRSG